MLDLTNLIEAIGNDKETLDELLSVFISDTQESLNLLFNGIKENDWEKIRFNSHKIKGSMRIFGITSLGNLFEELEILAKTNQDKQKLDLLTDDLQNKIDTLFQYIKDNYL